MEAEAAIERTGADSAGSAVGYSHAAESEFLPAYITPLDAINTYPKSDMQRVKKSEDSSETFDGTTGRVTLLYLLRGESGKLLHPGQPLCERCEGDFTLFATNRTFKSTTGLKEGMASKGFQVTASVKGKSRPADGPDGYRPLLKSLFDRYMRDVQSYPSSPYATNDELLLYPLSVATARALCFKAMEDGAAPGLAAELTHPTQLSPSLMTVAGLLSSIAVVRTKEFDETCHHTKMEPLAKQVVSRNRLIALLRDIYDTRGKRRHAQATLLTPMQDALFWLLFTDADSRCWAEQWNSHAAARTHAVLALTHSGSGGAPAPLPADDSTTTVATTATNESAATVSAEGSASNNATATTATAAPSAPPSDSNSPTDPASSALTPREQGAAAFRSMADDASKWAALFAATAAQHAAIYAPHIVSAGSKESMEAAVHATLEAMPAVTDADLSKVVLSGSALYFQSKQRWDAARADAASFIDYIHGLDGAATARCHWIFTCLQARAPSLHDVMALDLKAGEAHAGASAALSGALSTCGSSGTWWGGGTPAVGVTAGQACGAGHSGAAAGGNGHDSAVPVASVPSLSDPGAAYLRQHSEALSVARALHENTERIVGAMHHHSAMLKNAFDAVVASAFTGGGGGGGAAAAAAHARASSVLGAAVGSVSAAGRSVAADRYMQHIELEARMRGAGRDPDADGMAPLRKKLRHDYFAEMGVQEP